jgi:hypothetical protein
MNSAAKPIVTGRLQIRTLSPSDAEALSTFSCNDDDLDDFVRSDAGRYQNLNIAQTYLAFDGAKLVGFFSVAARD